MNLRDMLDVSPEVRDAVRFGHAVVALSTTALAHSIPDARRASFASDTEAAVRGGGAVPAWTAVLDGVLHVGLSPAQLGRICREPMAKITRRDLPAAAALHQTGATSASAALVLASLAGIRFFAAGGIGGVRGADVSADLRELCRTPVAVVCSGVNWRRTLRRRSSIWRRKASPSWGWAHGSFLRTCAARPASRWTAAWSAKPTPRASPRRAGISGSAAVCCLPIPRRNTPVWSRMRPSASSGKRSGRRRHRTSAESGSRRFFSHRPRS